MYDQAERKILKLISSIVDKQGINDMATSSMLRRATVAQEASTTSSINNSTMEMGGMVYPNIVGGTLAPAGQYPWFAVLLDDDGDDYCGATLIHPHVLLTAAHCIEDYDFKKKQKGLGVIIGDVKRDPNNIKEPAKYRTIVQSLLHPDYADDDNNNDFALLKLNLPVNTITPITLNTNASIPAEDETLTIMGFGMTREVFGNSPTKLRQVNVSVISHAACRARYFFSGDAAIDEETMFCAGELFGGKDSCNGDSGGPAITADGVQVGITSFGEGCARPFTPSVYAKVSGAMDFVQEGICTLLTGDRDAVPPGWCLAAIESDGHH